MTVPSRALLQSSVAAEIATGYAELGGRRAPALVLDIREKDLASLLRRGGPPQVMPGHDGEIPVSLGIDGFRGDVVPLGVLAHLAPRSIRLHSSLMQAGARGPDPASRALLKGIVAAATSTGVTSIAAQVDDPDSLQLAREVGVLAVQGAIVAPARAIDALTSLLHARKVELPDPPVDEPAPVPAAPSPAADRQEPAAPAPAIADIGAALAAEIGLDLPWVSDDLPDPGPGPAPVPEPRPAPTSSSFGEMSLPPSPFLLLRHPPPVPPPTAGPGHP
jgi:hypothetical protein